MIQKDKISIICEKGNDTLSIQTNKKTFSMTRDKFGDMSVSLSSEDENNYQDYIEFDSSSSIYGTINDIFSLSDDEAIVFDTIGGIMVLDKRPDSYRFTLSKEFYEGNKSIDLRLSNDGYSSENELLSTFESQIRKKCDEVRTPVDDGELTMVRTGESSMVVSVNPKEGRKNIGETYLTINKNNPLYNSISRVFLPFGGFAKFDICNGSLILIQEDKAFRFAYERWQDSDPANSSDFHTSLFDNTAENKALFRLFDLLRDNKESIMEDKDKPKGKVKSPAA